MKKLLYILLSTPLLLYSPTPGKAQTAGHKVDSVLIYDQNDSLIFMQEWFYNEQGTKTNEVQYTWTNGVKRGDINTFQAYDAKKHVVEDVVLKWNEVTQEWLGDSRIETVYNASNKVARGIHFGWEEDQWSSDSTWTFEYDAQGKTTLTLRQGFHNGQWMDQYKMIQDYDANKKEIYREEYSGRDANGLIGKTKWQKIYSGSTVISNHQYSWSKTDAVFVPKSWDTIGIENGKTVLKESYTWTNEVQKGKSKEEWAFNADGRQILHITYSGWVDNAFVPKEKQVDEWSGSTNTLTAKYTWDKTNKKWVGTSKTENLTSDGYTIKKAYSGWENDDFKPSTIDSTKTENGKKVYYVKWTYKNGAWVGTSKEIYAYEGSNQTLQEKYSSWSNGSWIGSNSQKWEQIWKNNKVWSNVTYNWSSGWVPSIKDSTEYSGSDITLSVHYKYVNDAWEGDNGKNNYSQTYISAGQKEWTTTLKWEDNQWTNFIQTKSTYSGGKLVEERSQQWNGSAWIDIQVITHKWENGVEVFTRTEAWNAESQKLKMTSQYKYVLTKDSQGRNIEEYKMKCGSDSVWVGTGYARSLWYYETRGDSAITSAVNYKWSNAGWIPEDSSAVWRGVAISSQVFINAKFKWTGTEWQYKSLATNIYDAKGRLISEDSRNYQNNAWIGVFWYLKEYDEYDNLISDVRYSGGAGGQWKGDSRYDYGFDKFGNQTKMAYFRWNEKTNEWELTKLDESMYDAQSRCTMSRHSYLSAVTGEMVYESYEEYAYLDNDTEPSSTLQYEYVVPAEETEERWIVKQEDTYKYDNNDSSQKLREEIHGTWSKGVVTSYKRTVYYYNDDPK